MQRKLFIILYAVLTSAVMIMIFVLSAQDGTASDQTSLWLLNTKTGAFLMEVFPNLTAQGPEIDIRKYAHIAEYSLLSIPTFLLFRELISHKTLWRSTTYTLVLNYLYACSDELHQAFVPGRSSSFPDTLVDLAGTVIGLLAVLMVTVLRKEAK